jgi:hypothetical protein
MVDGVFKLYAQRLRHFYRRAGSVANLKCLDVTPFLFSDAAD